MPLDMNTNPMGPEDTLMPQMPMAGMPTGAPTGGDVVEGGAVTAPKQGGLLDSGTRPARTTMFEDYFPKLDLTEEQEKELSSWFNRDLRSCVKNVNEERHEWATYRSVFMLDYMLKMYPDIGLGIDYTSGLLAEKVLEAMDRMKRSVFGVAPMFMVDTEMSGTKNDVTFMNRAQWVLESMLVKNLKVKERLRDDVIFDFVMDGSAIVEADTMFDKVSVKTLRTYTTADDLAVDEDRVVDSSRLDTAYIDIATKGSARVLVEEDVITEDGLTLFHVPKVDHLIPAGVYKDDGIRFRARRMYLTGSDLMLMSSEEVGWYDRKKVEKVIGARGERKGYRAAAPKDVAAKEKLTQMDEYSDLMYDMQEEQDLKGAPGDFPYENFYTVYRITCKYGYKTSSDPEGKLPKYCCFDYSPEGGVILRSITYPHFTETRNWFHFKLGYAPDSYYGYGFGKRLLNDDYIESNAVDIFLESAVMSSFRPLIAKHPEAGGMFPFPAGYGPAKVGYVMDMNDVKVLESSPPSPALLSVLLPLIQVKSENRTNITSLIQGRTESSDPRSPAAKTGMLINEANVGLDMMVDDWNVSGWNPMANFVWKAMYEIATYMFNENPETKSVFDGLVTTEAAPDGVDNVVSIEELGRDIWWKSQASSDVLNSELRMQKGLQLFQFFVPMLEKMAQFNPQLFQVYFMRWMKWTAQTLSVPGITYLIPTQQEIQSMPADAMVDVLRGLSQNLRAGRGPGMLELGATAGQPTPEGGVQ
ncbi:MAG: hypothetical protein WC822_01500 [Candidatus Paceibacterota bacterium]|jgi:hypothetical protein